MKPKSWTESDVDLGRLTLRQYVNAKRKAKQNEIKKYEQKYLARYKQPKAGLKKSESYLHIPEEPKRDINKERKDYEKEYLARYKKQPKARPKRRALKLLEVEPKSDIKKDPEERDAVLKAWERTQNIYGYSQQKVKPKKSASKQLEQEPKTDESE